MNNEFVYKSNICNLIKNNKNFSKLELYNCADKEKFIKHKEIFEYLMELVNLGIMKEELGVFSQNNNCLDANQLAVLLNIDGLIKCHLGEYVLVSDGKIVEVVKDKNEIEKLAKEKYINQKILIKKIS